MTGKPTLALVVFRCIIVACTLSRLVLSQSNELAMVVPGGLNAEKGEGFYTKLRGRL